jgi:hypothetical protein
VVWVVRGVASQRTDIRVLHSSPANIHRKRRGSAKAT